MKNNIFSTIFYKFNIYFTIFKVIASILAISLSMSASALVCPSDFTNNNGTLTCECNGTPGPNLSLWGTYVYTDDSNICAAAVQAGKKTWFESKSVTVYEYDGMSHYQGKSVYGVASMNWGPWPRSFTFDNSLLRGYAYKSTNLQQLNALATSSNSITFVIGSDPQFGFHDGSYNYDLSEIHAKVAMAQAADIVDECSSCAPAIAIAGDLVMDNSPGILWPGVVDMYDSALQGVNNVSNNQVVVLDGLGNHDSALNLHTYFENSGKTGSASKYSKWSESSAYNGKSCWNNTYSAAYYCALLTSLKYYSTKLANAYESVHVVQLHNGGVDYADPDTISYLQYLKTAITDGKPLVLVLHHVPESHSAFDTAVSQLNVAAILYGHWHADASSMSQSSKTFTNSNSKSFKAVNISSFIKGAYTGVNIASSGKVSLRKMSAFSNANSYTSYDYK